MELRINRVRIKRSRPELEIVENLCNKASLEFSRNTQSWQCWHLIQMHRTIFKGWKRFHFFPEFLIKMYMKLLGKDESFVYNTFAISVKNYFLFIIWILSNAFELGANVVNFVYYGKTRLSKFHPTGGSGYLCFIQEGNMGYSWFIQQECQG